MKRIAFIIVGPIVLFGCHYNRACVAPAPAAPAPYNNDIYGAYVPEPAPVVAQPAPVVIPADQPIVQQAAVVPVRVAAKKSVVKKAVAKKPVKKKARLKPKSVPAATETCPPAADGSEAIFIKRVRTLPDGTQQVVSEYQAVPK